MLLLAFMDCGLIEGLIQLSSNLPRDSLSDAEKERSRIVAQKATVLLGELLHLSNTLLPPSQCARIQVLLSFYELRYKILFYVTVICSLRKAHTTFHYFIFGFIKISNKK